MQRELIRPLSVASVHGLVWREELLLAADPHTGYLLEIDPNTEKTTIANGKAVRAWHGVTGLATLGEHLWVLRDDRAVMRVRPDYELESVLDLDFNAGGIALGEQELFVSSRDDLRIYVYDRDTGVLVRELNAPGMGEENLTFHKGELWVADRVEQTVYCLDPETGQVRFSIMTPYEYPTGLAFAGEFLYVAYSQKEHYIEEDPNRYNRLSVEHRDKTLIHRLKFRTDPETHYTLSNGYLVEVVYCEETAALDPVAVENLVWQIALPADTPRQKLVHVEAIGRPFREVVRDGQRVAVFEFDLAEDEVQLFGWKALVELRGIRYDITPEQLDPTVPIPDDIQALYLQDDDDLAMDTRRVQEAARDAVGTLSNPLSKMLAIREFVYDKLDYRIRPSIDPPDVVLERNKGSCGEYVGVMLALARLSGIPCRTVGRYKCPPHQDTLNYPLQPRYNHVWIEFYLAGYGWLPSESNADDLGSRPYPKRFFMGLPWYHIELGKGISFEKMNASGYSLADLSINHVQVTIVKELPD